MGFNGARIEVTKKLRDKRGTETAVLTRLHSHSGGDHSLWNCGKTGIEQCGSTENLRSQISNQFLGWCEPQRVRDRRYAELSSKAGSWYVYKNPNQPMARGPCDPNPGYKMTEPYFKIVYGSRPFCKHSWSANDYRYNLNSTQPSGALMVTASAPNWRLGRGQVWGQVWGLRASFRHK